MRSDNYGLGYWARLSVQRGEKLFSIPYEACINYNVTLENPESNMTPLSIRKSGRTMKSEMKLPALYLIIASRRQPEESKYYPYLNFLPGKIKLPLLWRPDQLEIRNRLRYGKESKVCIEV